MIRKRLSVKPGSWVPCTVPKGYSLGDFQRFEIYEDAVEGVLYSGKHIECTASTFAENKTWFTQIKEAWEKIWLLEK